MDSETFWNHLDTFALGTKTLPTFPPETLLVSLCAHGCKHAWQRLKWVCDVAELIQVLRQRGRLNGLEEALVGGNRRMVGIGLLLAHDLLSAILPHEVIKHIRSDSVTSSVATEVCQRLFAEPKEIFGERRRFAYYLKIRESWSERLKYCAQVVAQYLNVVFCPTSVEYDLWPLTKRLAFLYYGFRPLRLVAKYGLRPFRRVC